LADQPWGPGYVIAGKYRLTEKLGQGGMGAVWRADHLTLNAPVAVKLLDPSIANTEEGLARFMREAQSAAALRSTHVVQTFDYGVHEGVPFIVMELLVGQSLAHRLSTTGPLPATAVASILKQVARAITKAHQAGIIHRDLKPDNVFLVETDDDEPVAKVLDFGIAKANGDLALNAASKTRTGALLGTPFYMSPEQAQGTVEVDYRTDLWALAVITYEALLGKRPFESEALGDLLLKICVLPVPIPSKVGNVPPGFDAWFAKAASRDPAQRFTSAGEMARALERVVSPGQMRVTLDSVSLDAFPIPSMGPAGDSLEGTEVVASGGTKKRPAALFGGVAVAAVAVLVGIGVAVRGGHAPAAAAASVHRGSTAGQALVAEQMPPAATAPEPTPAAAPSASVEAPTTEPPAADSAAAEEPPAAALRKTKATSAKRSAAKASAAHEKPSSVQGGSFDPLQMRR
jgi:serine/threonine-protein kinase